MLGESSLWLSIDQHSGLIGANANNTQVMDSDWTALDQPGGISPHASHCTQTLYQCPRTRGQFECDWGTQRTWQWRRRPIGSHGSMTHYGGGYKLSFLLLIQREALKALIGSVNVSFLLHLFCLSLSCYWKELVSDQPSIWVWRIQNILIKGQQVKMIEKPANMPRAVFAQCGNCDYDNKKYNTLYSYPPTNQYYDVLESLQSTRSWCTSPIWFIILVMLFSNMLNCVEKKWKLTA